MLLLAREFHLVLLQNKGGVQVCQNVFVVIGVDIRRLVLPILEGNIKESLETFDFVSLPGVDEEI